MSEKNKRWYDFYNEKQYGAAPTIVVLAASIAWDEQQRFIDDLQSENAKLLEEMKNLNQDKQTLMTHCDSLRTENLRLKEMLERMAGLLEAFDEIPMTIYREYTDAIAEYKKWKDKTNL